MSEKRFKFKDGAICDNELERYYVFDKQIISLLNEQQDKITELEIELTDCKNRKEQSEYNLRRENENLRQKSNALQTSLNYWQKSYREVLEKIPPKVKEVWLE